MKVINERVNGLNLSKAAKETLKKHNYIDKNNSSNDIKTTFSENVRKLAERKYKKG